MKRFLLAFIMFSAWFAIAGSYYTFIIKGAPETPKTVEKPKEIEKKPTKQITTIYKPLLPKKDSIAVIDTLKIKTIDSLKIAGLTIKDKDLSLIHI